MRRKMPALSVMQRMFWSFAGIVIMATLLIGAVSLSQLADALNAEQVKDFTARANQIERYFQQGMKQAWQQADNILSSSFVRSVTSGYYTDNDYELAQYQRQLHVGLEMNTVIDGMFLYFPGSDMVLSTISLQENRENFFRYGITLEDIKEQTLPEMIEGITYRKALLVEANYLGKTRKGLLLLQRDVMASADRAAVIGLMLPIDDALSELVTSFGQSFQLTVSQDQRRYSYGASFLSDIGDEAVFDKGGAVKARTFTADGESGYAFLCGLGHDINLEILQKKSGIAASIARVRWTFIIMLTAVFLASIALVYFMARQNARPITELLAVIPKQPEQPADEIKRLYTSVTELVRKEQEIRGKMDQTLPRFRRYLIERMITSDEPLDETGAIAIGIAGLDTMYHRVYMTLSNFDPPPMENAYVFKVKSRWVTVAGMPAPVKAGVSVHLHSWKELACAYRMAEALLSANGIDPLSSASKRAEKGIARVHSGLSSMAKEMEALFPARHTQIDLREDGALFYQGMVGNGYLNAHTAEQAQQLYEDVVENRGDEAIKKSAWAWMEQVLSGLKCEESRQKDENMRNRIKEEIAGHYLEPDYSLEGLADGLGLSASYVSTLINNSFDSGFVDMVNMRRVRYAAELLRKDDMMLEQIAQASGFQSAATFRRAFKKVYDMPPAQWRASVKTKQKGDETE